MQSNLNKSKINLNKDKKIEILEQELEHSIERLSNAENENENLYQLLDQQQLLSLGDKNKIQALELEVENSDNKKSRSERKYRKIKGFIQSRKIKDSS